MRGPPRYCLNGRPMAAANRRAAVRGRGRGGGAGGSGARPRAGERGERVGGARRARVGAEMLRGGRGGSEGGGQRVGAVHMAQAGRGGREAGRGCVLGRALERPQPVRARAGRGRGPWRRPQGASARFIARIFAHHRPGLAFGTRARHKNGTKRSRLTDHAPAKAVRTDVVLRYTGASSVAAGRWSAETDALWCRCGAQLYAKLSNGATGCCDW